MPRRSSSACLSKSATWAVVTASFGLASSIFRQTAAVPAFRSAWGPGGVAQDQGTPVAEGVGVIGLGLIEGLVLLGGLGELSVLG